MLAGCVSTSSKISLTEPIDSATVVTNTNTMDPSQFPDREDLNLNEWEQIPSPSLDNTHPTTSPPRDWDMVAIRDTYLQHSPSLFPPSLHQDLPVLSSLDEQPNSPPPSPSSLSSSPSSGVSSSDVRPGVVYDVGRRLSSGIVRIAAKVRYCAVYVGGFWSFAAMAGLVATVLLSLLYARVRRRRRRVRQDENNGRLILLIREKDQKINQLLLQVSQMSQLLSARRRVPVLRIG